MRKIYTYLFFVFTFLAATTPCIADEAMNVMSEGKCISSSQLESLENITFSDSQILIHLTDGSVVKHDFAKFDKIIFGEYIPFVGIDEITSENTEFNVFLSEEKVLTVESSAIITSIKLIDLSGKTTQVNISGDESNIVSISVKSLATGLYIVLAETEDGLKTNKLIIK